MRGLVLANIAHCNLVALLESGCALIAAALRWRRISEHEARVGFHGRVAKRRSEPRADMVQPARLPRSRFLRVERGDGHARGSGARVPGQVLRARDLAALRRARSKQHSPFRRDVDANRRITRSTVFSLRSSAQRGANGTAFSLPAAACDERKAFESCYTVVLQSCEIASPSASSAWQKGF